MNSKYFFNSELKRNLLKTDSEFEIFLLHFHSPYKYLKFHKKLKKNIIMYNT